MYVILILPKNSNLTILCISVYVFLDCSLCISVYVFQHFQILCIFVYELSSPHMWATFPVHCKRVLDPLWIKHEDLLGLIFP